MESTERAHPRRLPKDKASLNSLHRSNAENVSNWTALKTRWRAFLLHTGGLCWSGPRTRDLVLNRMSGKDVPVGCVALGVNAPTSEHGPFDPRSLIEGDPWSRGALCTGFIKYPSDKFQRFSICLKNGYFTTLGCKQFRNRCPVALLKELLDWLSRSRFHRPVPLVRVPDAVPDFNFWGFSANSVFEDMRRMLLTLGRGWWGEVHSGRAALFELLDELNKEKTPECPRPCAALILVEEDSRGYLFSVMASDGITYTVHFNGFGYDLFSRGYGDKEYFLTLDSLLHFLTYVEDVRFVARPFPTLKELSRTCVVKCRIMDRGVNIPKPLKEFIVDSPYARCRGMKETKIVPKKDMVFSPPLDRHHFCNL